MKLIHKETGRELTLKSDGKVYYHYQDYDFDGYPDEDWIEQKDFCITNEWKRVYA